MQDSGPITTAISQISGRLKTGASFKGKKKRLLKEMVGNCKKGKGGPGVSNPPGYGNIATKTSLRMTSKPHRASVKVGGVRMKGIKKPKSILSAMNALSKKMKFGKVVKSARVKSLKSMVKNII